MIREKIKILTCWYNRKDSAMQRIVLVVFCMVLVLLGWISIRFITFNTRDFQQKMPANIGSPSGFIPADTVKLNQH